MAKSVTTKYYPDATAKCANCSSIYTLGLTVEHIQLENCGNCHPFYTGLETLLDTAGRIEKFQQRASKAVKAGENEDKKPKVKLRKSRQSLADLTE